MTDQDEPDPGVESPMIASGLIGVISDIHANLTALENVLAFLDNNNVKQIYCLGDVVGYGASSPECMRLLRQRNVLSVQGNHDAQVREPRDPRMRGEAVAGLILAELQLDKEDKDYLAELPSQRIIRESRCLLVHGAITDRDDYILSYDSVDDNLKLLSGPRYAPDCDVCFFGHTHLAMVLTNNAFQTTITENYTFDLSVYSKVMVNPGSVGQPRDGCPHSSFAMYEPEKKLLHVIRLPYDIAQEQERMAEAGLPERSIKRLAEGK